jgi:four helix bundle protein
MMNQSAQPATDRVTTAGCNSGSIEKVDCYRLAIEFAAAAATLVPRGHASLRDQLERASTSVALNLSEGWGRWRAREKAQFYAIARGSLLESMAAIDLIQARGLAGEAECGRARELCARVGQMLNGLIRAMERRAAKVTA